MRGAKDRLEEFSPEARSLLQPRLGLLESLHAAFRPLVVRQVRGWDALFPPERDSLAALLRELGETAPQELESLFRPFRPLALPDLSDLDPLFDEEKTLERCLRRFRQDGAYQTWRGAVDAVFQTLQSRAARRAQAEPAGPKLVCVVFGEGTGRGETLDDVDRRYLSYFWNHLEPAGALFTRARVGAASLARHPFFALARGSGASPQIKLWAIETGRALQPAGPAGADPIWLSFEHLRPVLDRVTRRMADTMVEGIGGPEALQARVSGFDVGALGLPSYSDPRIHKFIETVILRGSGALVVNNTFAEWAAVQALRRVEPDALVVRMGRRRRFVPLRQLDPFQSGPAAGGDLAPEDAAESLQDADVLAYYLWLETRKNARYSRTYFLVLLEGSDAALLLGPGVRAGARIEDEVGLGELGATVARLMACDPAPYGRVVEGALHS